MSAAARKPKLVPDELATQARAACEDWLSQRAYVNGRGTYHRKEEKWHSSGPVAPWNKAAQFLFRGSDELHSVAHKPEAEREAWIRARVAGQETLRVDWWKVKEAKQTLFRHGSVLDLAVAALGPEVQGLQPTTIVYRALCLLADGWRPPTVPCADVHGFPDLEGT